MSELYLDVAMAVGLARAGREDAKEWWAKALEHSPPAWRERMQADMNLIVNTQWSGWVTERQRCEGLRLMTLGLVSRLEEERERPPALSLISGGAAPRKRPRKPPKLQLIEGGANA